jgi:ABC-type multidrug transport system permease subunit
VAIGGMFAAAQPLLLRFPLDRAIFLREYATSSYGGVPYFLSKSMVELPQSLIQSIITWLAVYWIMGFHGSILVHTLVFWLAGLAAASTALLVGCLASNPEVAQQAGPAILVPQLLFAGFFIKTEQIPIWLRWAQYLCSLKYGINLLLLNEFGESTRADWSDAQKFMANSIIEGNDINPDLWWVNLIVLLGLVVFFRSMAILALSRRAATFF